MFNIRVYGILINESHQVLVADELVRGMRLTKFCGGGLEPGEGTRDCLVREFMEEMNLKIEVTSHFYTTDFYQPSAFNNAHQILSIYYFATALEAISVPLRNKPFDFDAAQLQVYNERQEIETFRLIEWDNFDSKIVTLPIDKIVADLVRANHNI